jgi:hypothetical protein
MITFCKNSDPKISKFSLLWFLKPRIYSSNWHQWRLKI